MIDQIILSWAISKALDIIVDTVISKSKNISPHKVIYITPELGFKIVSFNDTKIIISPTKVTSTKIGSNPIEIDISDKQAASSSLLSALNNRLKNNLDTFLDTKLDNR